VKIGIIPEKLVERLAPALGLVPAPAIEAWFSFMLARVIMAGTRKVRAGDAVLASVIRPGKLRGSVKRDVFGHGLLP